MRLGSPRVSRGARQVTGRWKAFFEGAQAPFSWEPEQVEVVDSGALVMTSGPARDPSGKRVGPFNSVWRREADGRWLIVLDNGCPACNCDPTGKRIGLRLDQNLDTRKKPPPIATASSRRAMTKSGTFRALTSRVRNS